MSRFAVSKNMYRGTLMVNICDEELLDKELREGELVIKISSKYFCNTIVDEEEAINLLKKSSIANLVGENIVKNALKLKLASDKSVRIIDGIPFLMIFKFKATY